MAGAGYKTFTAGSILTASDVNTYLMEQSTMLFASTTARDAAITAPADGMMCYINSGDANEGLYSYNGTSWRKGPGWNAPWGYMGRATATSNQGSITGSGVDLTNQSLTLSLINNRAYAIYWAGRVSSTVTTDTAATILNIAGSNGAATISYADGTSYSYSFVHLCSSTASTTIKLVGQRQSGSGTLTWQASSTTPLELVVFDVGPHGAPA